jgi:hypothetical protein
MPGKDAPEQRPRFVPKKNGKGGSPHKLTP